MSSIFIFFKNKRPWDEIPEDERIGILFRDLGIFGILSDCYCYIRNIEKLDKLIIKSKSSYDLYVISPDRGLYNPEYNEEYIRWRFISAQFKDKKIYIQTEVYINGELVHNDLTSIAELRRMIEIKT